MSTSVAPLLHRPALRRHALSLLEGLMKSHFSSGFSRPTRRETNTAAAISPISGRPSLSESSGLGTLGLCSTVQPPSSSSSSSSPSSLPLRRPSLPSVENTHQAVMERRRRRTISSYVNAAFCVPTELGFKGLKMFRGVCLRVESLLCNG